MLRSLIALLALMLGASRAESRVWHVAPDGTGDVPTIQAAVDSSSAGDIVELGAGVFTGPGNRDVLVPKPLTILSTSGAVIDCEGAGTEPHRGLDFWAPTKDGYTCEVRGLTIRNGRVTSNGGAIRAQDQVVADIYDCAFEDNRAAGGGALAYDSVDWMGHVGRGARSPAPIVRGSSFARNAAVHSGAVKVSSVMITFEDCVFTENEATESGGVTRIDFHTSARFDRCLLVQNTAQTGGALYNDDGWGVVERCTFVGNAASRGAHIASSTYDDVVQVAHSILAFGEGGGAVACSGDPYWDYQVEFSCTTAFGNEGGDFILCLVDDENVNGNLNADPLFCDWPAGDYTLRSDSPCASPPCGRMGAFDVGCGPSTLESSTWSELKSRFR